MTDSIARDVISLLTMDIDCLIKWEPDDKMTHMLSSDYLQTIRVAELFAGVGGFRLGLEGYGDKRFRGYSTIWSNQWEPTTKAQHASDIYCLRFGAENHSNFDIATVPTHEIPDHDLLVGGFPCQDYSVARTLSQAAGLSGKKGVLWWEIHRILKVKGAYAPQFLFLENVDRLLKSPASQRGRDFAVMLASLSDLGYMVEWRVINAADYGMPQRRKRTYILGYKKNSPVYEEFNSHNSLEWLNREGVFAKAFPVEQLSQTPLEFSLDGDLAEITVQFNKKGKKSPTPFENAGVMVDRKVYTNKTNASYSGPYTVLGDILLTEDEVPEEFFIDDERLQEWLYLKGAKREKRITKDGFEYDYSEGPMKFPDSLDRPARTIVTGEGGASPSRFKHVIQTASGRYRRLTPLELERANMFPDNHTEGASDVKRAFLMGNALVVGVIEKVGRELYQRVNTESKVKKVSVESSE